MPPAKITLSKTLVNRCSTHTQTQGLGLRMLIAASHRVKQGFQKSLYDDCFSGSYRILWVLMGFIVLRCFGPSRAIRFTLNPKP